jgi:hypothetical protein
MTPAMASTEQRSQPLLRLPKNQTPAHVTLHDGQDAQVSLFVAPGDSLSHYVVEDSRFVPMGFARGTRLVARDTLAAISIHVVHAPVEDELPGERQHAQITLHSGGVIEGELRWVAPEGQRRTLDYLNTSSPYVTVYTNEHVTYVFKSHIASVEEIRC